jgi:metallophosphoesterase (TIGR00282 family)
MQLRILCVGDVVGKPGRRILSDVLSTIVAERELECVVVNAENATDGAGLAAATYEKVISAGASVITLGDHVYRRRDIIPVLEKSDRMVRPANLRTGAPGREWTVFTTVSGHAVAVVSLLGRMFMKTLSDCPFAAVDRVLAALPEEVKIVVVDMHAEATSEKIAMGWHLDGRVSAVFGTHTHVATADERILPKGTAYITDVGMTGPHDSVLGRDKRRVVGAMTSGVPAPFDVATGDLRVSGVIVTIETTTGLATQIERVSLTANRNI